jgi:hypothetical protein
MDTTSYLRLMYKVILTRLSLFGAALLACSAMAKADSISITNFSFESPTLSPGQFTNYGGDAGVQNIPGWTAAGDWQGVQNGTGGSYASVPDGVNYAYDDGGTIRQTLSSTLEVGTYTLSVYDGNREGRFSGGTLELFAGSTLLGSAALTAPADNTFALTSFDVTALSSDANLGQALTIDLIGNGTGEGSVPSVDFDDVQLNFIAVPEPSTWAMMLGGVAVLAALARWTRRTVRA